MEDNICNSSSAEINIETERSIAAEVEQLNENNHSEIEVVEVIDRDRQLIEAELVEDSPSANSADRSCIAAQSSTKVWNWLPDGPWNVGGKLDPNFRDWLAKDWIARYGGTIHQKRADEKSAF